MKNLISILLVLMAISGASADLVELSYKTSVVYSSSSLFQKYDTVTYVFRYDTDVSGKMTLSDGTVMDLGDFFDNTFYAEIGSSAFTDDKNVSLETIGARYYAGVNIVGDDKTITDAFLYLGSDYHTINIFTESHDTVGTDNGIDSWAADTSLNLKIVETIVRSENDTDIVITHFPLRLKPTPPPASKPPQNVPEPSVATSMFLGMIVLSGTAVRRYLQKKR